MVPSHEIRRLARAGWISEVIRCLAFPFQSLPGCPFAQPRGRYEMGPIKDQKSLEPKARRLTPDVSSLVP